jgi:membrane protein YqaA with SNARE-associated domain
MHALTTWLLDVFLSPIGLVVLGVLDGSILTATPFALDAAVVVLVARHREAAWLYPILATAGSVVGTAGTFWLGRVIGEQGLVRHLTQQQADRALARVRDTGAIPLALLDLIPPPFPFTPFVLVAGALELNAWRFLTAVAAVKLVRFGLEAALALVYGGQILDWMSSDLAAAIGGTLALIIIALSAYSAMRLLRRRGSSASSRPLPRP